jgi:PPK2 family polyphosphate:nucleotide phosphotransferase
MNSKKFRVKPDQKVDLDDWPTRVDPLYKSKKHYKELLDDQIKALAKLQSQLYADNRYALLLIFQAMDAAGKDGAIKHVMSGINPQGCQVFSFKHPSAEELDHDFLWRTTRNLPERGRIGIFNRSYYEEVLIVRVHPELLRAEGLPFEDEDLDKLWKQRYESIAEMEKHLHRNGTRIIKFFLHLSKEEQRQRFLSRIEEPEKNWKFSMGDVKERSFWKQYMEAYEDCLAHTSSKHAPWYVIPADDKENARLLIADVIVESLRDLKVDYPKITAQQRKDLAEAGRLFNEEK